MSNGSHIIGAGLRALETRLDLISTNLANVGTPGFRRSTSSVELFESALQGSLASRHPKIPVQTSRIDFTAGSPVLTGNPLDVAIDGPGFFEVRSDDGSLGYTRGGRFTRNAKGELATTLGFPVIGEGGPIAISGNGPVAISSDGSVLVDKESVGKLKLVDFARLERLKRGRNGLLEAGPDALERTIESPRFSPGAYEGSNVEATRELISMIETQRSYERKNRAIKMINEASAALVRAAQG